MMVNTKERQSKLFGHIMRGHKLGTWWSSENSKGKEGKGGPRGKKMFESANQVA